MALIGKIRQNMWFVFALLGVALVAFMMMDSNPGGGGGASGQTALSVNGDKIDINTLQSLETFESNATGLSGNSLRSKVYDDFITRSIVNSEGEKLGLGVSEDELEQLLSGARLSPIIQQMPLFQDQRTRRINPEFIQNFRTSYAEGNLQRGYMSMWDEKLKQVETSEVQNKISTLVSKAIYTPTWMAEELSKTNGLTAGIEYVKVPFTSINDSDVSLTDADYTAFMADNKSQFFQEEEGRVVEYAVFSIDPTTEDSINIRQDLTGKLDLFKNSDSDSTYALANGGNYINYYFPKADLPEAYQTFVSDIEIGDVYGPVINERFYSAMKLIDKKIVPDSVKLSHIFKPTIVGVSESVETAVQFIDSLKNIIESGVASYDSVAIKNSQDPSSAANGGDLGYITQGQFFPAINEVAFFSGKIGDLYRVTTQNGVHLIKVTERIFTTEDPKFKVAFINNGIEPSLETIDKVTNLASGFVSDNRDLESMRAAISKNENVTLKSSKILSKKDYQFEEFSFDDDARDIVLWAFNDETEAGDVSPDMFSFRDKQFNYERAIVIPALQAKTAKGMSSLSNVKNSITDQVMAYAKGKKLAEMLKGKSLADGGSLSGATTGTIDAVRTGSSFVGELGYEPKVMAAIIATPQGSMTQPIVGASGVYLIKLNSKSAPNTGNSVFAKQSENSKARQNVNFNLFEAMKNGAKIKDKRMDFSI